MVRDEIKILKYSNGFIWYQVPLLNGLKCGSELFWNRDGSIGELNQHSRDELHGVGVFFLYDIKWGEKE